MKSIDLKEMQLLQINILKDVHNFCEENKLKYYLAGGTLLGAIRHKGFIPWDDDIDIIMPRPDYERFLKIYKPKNESYVLTCTENNPNHLYTYAKIFDNRTEKIENGIIYSKNNYGGVDIDIFPMDGLPEDIETSNKFFIKQKKLFTLYTFALIEFSKSKNIFKTLPKYLIAKSCRLIGKGYFINKINNNGKQYDFDKCKYVACSVVPYYGNKERVLKENYAKQILVDFDGEKFYAPAGYEEYLSNLYGNYMELPPVEKRVTHHSYKVYWK